MITLSENEHLQNCSVTTSNKQNMSIHISFLNHIYITGRLPKLKTTALIYRTVTN